jgi:hypothetical protein
MTDTYSQLKDELSVLYPDVTDAELNEMTERLIDFFVTGAKAIYETEKAVVSEKFSITDIDDSKREEKS